MPYLLLPGDQVPDECAGGHKAKEHDDNNGGERGDAEDGEGHDGVSGEAILPDVEC